MSAKSKQPQIVTRSLTEKWDPIKKVASSVHNSITHVTAVAQYTVEVFSCELRFITQNIIKTQIQGSRLITTNHFYCFIKDIKWKWLFFSLQVCDCGRHSGDQHRLVPLSSFMPIHQRFYPNFASTTLVQMSARWKWHRMSYKTLSALSLVTLSSAQHARCSVTSNPLSLRNWKLSEGRAQTCDKNLQWPAMPNTKQSRCRKYLMND